MSPGTNCAAPGSVSSLKAGTEFKQVQASIFYQDIEG
jgi:hypothetical protein